jgi:hypothetical protein
MEQPRHQEWNSGLSCHVQAPEDAITFHVLSGRRIGLVALTGFEPVLPP